MIYLASPYTHEDPAVEQRRYVQVCKAAARLISEGQYVYSPIAHSRAIALEGNLPTDYKFWTAYDTDMISKCSEMIVLTLQGWEDSQGVQAEIKIARAIGIPVRYLNYHEPFQGSKITGGDRDTGSSTPAVLQVEDTPEVVDARF